jgi:hypothetical protein
MLEILVRIEESIQGLPSDGRVCSVSLDPNPLLSFVSDVRRGIDLCRVCLAHYDDPDQYVPLHPWTERFNNQVHRSQPWFEYTVEVWLARRDRALRVLLQSYESSLGLEYEDIEAVRTGAAYRCKFRPADILYALQAHLLLCAYAKMAPEDRTAMTAYAAHRGNEYVRRELLSLNDEAVGRYSVRQLTDALEWLCARMNELRYDDLLVLYMLQLQMQAARLLFTIDTAVVHDKEEFREVVEEGSVGAGLDTQYKANDKLLAVLCASSVSLYARLFTAKLLPRALPGEISPLTRIEPEVSRALRLWFVRKAKHNVARVASDWLKRLYIEVCLWPGERDFYRIHNPRDSTATTLAILAKNRDPSSPSFIADRAVIKTRRGVQYRQIIEDAERSPADIVETLAAEPNTIESPLLQLALVEFFALEVHKHWLGTDWNRYCVLWCDLDLQLESFQKEPYVPCIVQVFHHCQLIYKRTVITYDSFIESLCGWFAIMSRRRRAPHWTEANRVYLESWHLSPRISVEDTAREIFSKVPFCRAHWWPEGTRFDEEDDVSNNSLPKAPPALYSF